MNTFSLQYSDVHSLAKLIGVAFYALNNGNNPPSITFSINELEKMFTLHEHMFQYIDHQESLARDKADADI